MSDRPPALAQGLVGVVPLAASRLLRRLAALALASPALLAVVELIARPWSNPTWLTVWRTSLLAGPGLAIVLGLAGVLVASTRSKRSGSVRLDGDDLVLETDGGERRISRASVRSGVVVPDVFGRAARVEIELASGDQVFAEVDGVAAGEALFQAAGIDAAQRRCTVPLVAPSRAALYRGGSIGLSIFGMFMALGFVLQAIGPIPNTYVPVWLALTVAAAGLAARATRPKSITIGADGIVVPGFFRDRFVPFADLADVRAEAARVVVTLRDGSAPIRFRADAEAARAIALRVKEAMSARSDAPGAQARLDLLARGGRTIAAWREAAARAVERAGDYRAAAFSEDDLAALVASPDASAEHRLGAALALAAAGEEHRARVRIAANACASPRMRVALEKIAGGEADDDALEEALATEQAAATESA